MTGRDASAFHNESGGHRWQRVPPTEKRGRVHTSTITVAVLSEVRDVDVRLDPLDLEIRTTGSSGPGGQHVQKSDTAVVVTHRPTGLTVRMETRSQHRNKELALEVLKARLAERRRASRDRARNERRRELVGSGMRADKRRTVAMQRGQVTDHQSGARISTRRYLRGDVDALWPP